MSIAHMSANNMLQIVRVHYLLMDLLVFIEFRFLIVVHGSLQICDLYGMREDDEMMMCF